MLSASPRLALVLVLVSLCRAVPASADVSPEPIFTLPADVSTDPLVLPPSTLYLAGFGGQPRIANDGTWYGSYIFPMSNPNNPFEFTRDRCVVENGKLYLREGLQIPGEPNYVPVADLAFSQHPFFDFSIAGDGTVAQIIRGTDQFTLIGDGTPNANEIDVEDTKFDILLLDRTVIYTGGETIDVVPGLPAPNNGIQDLSTVKAASANRLLVRAILSAGGTFDPETIAFWEVTDPGQPTQTETLRFTNDDNNPIPGLNLNISTYSANEEDIDYNADGSILLNVDIEGAPFNTDGAIVYYNALTDTYELIAREGDPSPLPGRNYDSLFNKPVALNDNGDISFLASIDGDSNTDGILVTNGQVIAQEDMIVGTAVPGELQLGFANANIEMDAEGNIIWYGAWNERKENVCPNNPDISSSFVIFEGIFFNDQLILEGGVTEVHDVVIDGTLFPKLVVMDLPNTGYAGFHVSPDGRWLIVHALLAEPSPDICAYSINNDATPVAGVLLKIDLTQFTNPSPPGDIDGDGDVDGDDLALMTACLAGPDVSDPPAGCDPAHFAASDLNEDGDADVADFAVAQALLGT